MCRDNRYFDDKEFHECYDGLNYTVTLSDGVTRREVTHHLGIHPCQTFIC
jgi:hypothetical protein